MTNKDKRNVFEGELGERLYKKALEFVSKYSMHNKILDGVLVGFSGGADSVFLLEFLCEYRERSEKDFKILAVHVNHSIRGEEADKDEAFSCEYSASLGVEFEAHRVDAKDFAKTHGQSLEEAARNLRYKVFDKIIQSRNDISCIAVAHNATDNFETVLFNMMRGSGLRGLSGIPPVRDSIIRPVLSVSKSEILELLAEKNVKYVTDSTNFSIEYTRNYIRHEIIPKFSRLNTTPENSVSKLSENLRLDNSFIEECAKEFFIQNFLDGKIKVNKLVSLHKALLSRVIVYLAEPYGISLEKVHVDNISQLLNSGNFKLSLPKGAEFISESGYAYIEFPREIEEFSYKLHLGENVFEDFDDVIILSHEKIENSFSNVYKIAIQATVSFDIIDDGLFVRSKKDGDSYRFSGMTRKLKKLFNDREIPPSRRSDVPVFCDTNGIVWVPGFKSRDDEIGTKLHLAICKPKDALDNPKRSFYIL